MIIESAAVAFVASVVSLPAIVITMADPGPPRDTNPSVAASVGGSNSRTGPSTGSPVSKVLHLNFMTIGKYKDQRSTDRGRKEYDFFPKFQPSPQFRNIPQK